MAGISIALKLPRLLAGQTVVDKDGHPSGEFARFWDEHCTLIEDIVNGLILVETAVTGAISAANEAIERVADLERAASQIVSEINSRGLVDVQLLDRVEQLASQAQDLLLLASFGTPGESTSSSSSSSSASWIPLVDGSEPPNFITDGAGVLILVAHTP